MKVVATRDEFTHISEPYGTVKLVDCKLIEDEGGRLIVKGTITESNYCGALLCGVPVGGQRYKAGEEYTVSYLGMRDWEQGYVRHIAM